MKPHIWKAESIWHCGIGLQRHIGHGITPEKAYQAWSTGRVW